MKSRLFMLVVIVLLDSCKIDPEICKSHWHTLPETAEKDGMVRFDTNSIFLAMTNPYPPSYKYGQSYTGIALKQQVISMMDNFEFELDYHSFSSPDSFSALQVTFLSDIVTTGPGSNKLSFCKMTVKNYAIFLHMSFYEPDTTYVFLLNNVPIEGTLTLNRNGKKYTLGFQNDSDTISFSKNFESHYSGLQPKISVVRPHLGKCSVCINHITVDSIALENFTCLSNH